MENISEIKSFQHLAITSPFGLQLTVELTVQLGLYVIKQ